MIKRIAFVLMILTCPLFLFSQSKIGKQEIYSKWISMDKKVKRINGYKQNFDSIIVGFVDSLKIAGIDTFGIYKKDYVGAISDDSCDCGIVPWTAYIHWINKGLTYSQKITKCCRYSPKIIISSSLIRYYDNCRIKIDNERILPVITGASINNKGDLLITEMDIDHTTYYSIYCDLNGKNKFVSFQDFEIESEDNLFHTDNLNSIINSWKVVIESQINEVYK